MSFRVFLSHSVSPAKLGIVYTIAEEAARRGMQPYIPDRTWDPAQQLPERISSALQEADVCVAVATQFGSQLPWVNSEIAGAVERILRSLIHNARTRVGWNRDVLTSGRYAR